jgi:hypothetical protein
LRPLLGKGLAAAVNSFRELNGRFVIVAQDLQPFWLAAIASVHRRRTIWRSRTSDVGVRHRQSADEDSRPWQPPGPDNNLTGKPAWGSDIEDPEMT